jgi:hypothetical protein
MVCEYYTYIVVHVECAYHLPANPRKNTKNRKTGEETESEYEIEKMVIVQSRLFLYPEEAHILKFIAPQNINFLLVRYAEAVASERDGASVRSPINKLPVWNCRKKQPNNT